MSFRINHYSASGDHRSTHMIISIHNVTPIEVRKWRQLTSPGMFLRRIIIDQQVYLQFVHLSLNGVIIFEHYNSRTDELPWNWGTLLGISGRNLERDDEM